MSKSKKRSKTATAEEMKQELEQDIDVATAGEEKPASGGIADAGD